MASLYRFFFSPLDPNGDRFGTLSGTCSRTNLVLLQGSSSSKTSLCWAFCQSVCFASPELSALVVCERRRLERGAATPVLSEGSVASAAVWSRVGVKYVESGKEMLQVLSCLHMEAPHNKCVVIDVDWNSLGCTPEIVAKCVASLMEYAEFARRFHGTCIVTDNGEDAVIDKILKRYMTSIVTLTSVNQVSTIFEYESVKVKYSIANNCLSINKIL